MSIVWSFSSLKTFQQCPKKYYHTKIAKDIVEPDTTATLYGKSAHTVAEEYIRDDKPVPPQFSYMQETLDSLKAIPGEKHCEMQLGFADLVVINEEKKMAYSVDYKTSKSARYADVKQLDLVATGIFAKFPKIERIKSALLFVVSKEFVKAEHHAVMVPKYVEKPARDVARIEAALENGVWNPVQGPLCRFCSVKQCEYNRS
jgi:hypothetical protein